MAVTVMGASVPSMAACTALMLRWRQASSCSDSGVTSLQGGEGTKRGGPSHNTAAAVFSRRSLDVTVATVPTALMRIVQVRMQIVIPSLLLFVRVCADRSHWAIGYEFEASYRGQLCG